MNPVSDLPNGINDILNLGQVPVGVATLWLLYKMATMIERMISRVDAVLEIVLDNFHEKNKNGKQ